MLRMNVFRREIPPTNGLPLRAQDFVVRPQQSLTQAVLRWLHLPNEPIITCSGTVALMLALEVLAQCEPQRDEVIVPAYTCPLVVLAIVRAQCPRPLKIRLCDLAPESVDMDGAQLASVCSSRTLAVLATHLGGRVADVSSLKAIAEPHGARVIEDAAQGMGARVGGLSVGLAGDVAFFSLAVGKGLSTYEGGLLFAKEDALHERLRDHAAERLKSNPFWTTRRIMELLGYALLYRPAWLPYVYGRPLRSALQVHDEARAVGDIFDASCFPVHRLDHFRERVAANAFERLPMFLDEAYSRARSRISMLSALPGLRVADDTPGVRGVFPFLMALMSSRTHRDRVLDRLWTSGLGVSKLFVHTLPEYACVRPFLPESEMRIYPNAQGFADRMFTISNSAWLDDTAFKRVLESVRKVLA